MEKKRMKFSAKKCGIIAIGAIIMVGMVGCNTLESITISQQPAQTMFGQGQPLDYAGLVITANYKENAEQVTSGYSVQGYDPNTPGTQTITVSMTAKAGLISRTQQTTFTVTVVPVESISISQAPAATSFKQGDDANWNGLSIAVKFEKDAVPGVIVKPGTDSLTMNGYDKDKPGEQKITVAYYGKQTTFDVQVIGLDSISVTSPPDKVRYYTGEDVDIKGLVVKGTWSDQSTAQLDITNNDISYNKGRAGAQDVTVTYSGKTTTFPVTYIALDALYVDRPPTKVEYELGEELSLDGLRIEGTEAGTGDTAQIARDRLKITGYDPLRAGEQKITVTVGGQSDSFSVTVSNPFEGTWHGQWVVGRETGEDGKSRDVYAPVMLTIKGSAWTLRTQENSGGELKQVELRGTYTPDSNKHATLQCDDNKGKGDVNRDSSTVMRLKNGLIRNEITLDKE
ncbi:MAG: bacterial Ig-like domain-containing protein [Spirochaetaceae bacterium]|jgi:hypothetical protein|nr:bacterial Ig-like domain-containing protein [Spirochaetaceae bacterium]